MNTRQREEEKQVKARIEGKTNRKHGKTKEPIRPEL
jgi:hypothetical protein